jgi:hypothetical protein
MRAAVRQSSISHSTSGRPLVRQVASSVRNDAISSKLLRALQAGETLRGSEAHVRELVGERA